MEFAEPLEVTKPSECSWYHTFDWPDGSVVKGTWDYRPNVDDYLGRLDYSGKSVIEMGPASGYLTRAMEQRGADVTCIDIDPAQAWEIVPRRDRDTAAYKAQRTRGMPVLRKSWWLTREVFGGTAKLSECGGAALFDMRHDLKFDVGLVGSILQHFESPYRVLSALAEMCTTIVVTEPLIPRIGELNEFLPAATNNNLGSWWALSRSTVDRMMGTLEFEQVDAYESTFRQYDMTNSSFEDGAVDYKFYTHVYERAERNLEAFSALRER